MSELKKCPMCGEIPEFIRFQVDKTKPYLVTVVHDCKISGLIEVTDTSRNTAIAAWNRRANSE
ncbi:TPA: Lar family restriction alleviation protein [Proteus mirabilis]